LSLLAPGHVPVFLGLCDQNARDRQQKAIDAPVVQWNAANAGAEDSCGATVCSGEKFSLAEHSRSRRSALAWFKLDIEAEIDARISNAGMKSSPMTPGSGKWVDIELA